jgi:gluconokinase
MATGTGLFNPSKLAWDAELLKICEVSPEQLRPLNDDSTASHGPIGGRSSGIKKRPLVPGIGDGAASNLGCGATRPASRQLILARAGPPCHARRS